MFTFKANQKTLYQALKNLAWKHVPASTTRETGHGRRETRTIKVADRPDWIQFEGAVQVAQLRRTTWRKKSKDSPRKKSVEIVYLITSADYHAAPPATLATWVRQHWGIENKLHHVRDVTYDEDRSQIRTGNAPPGHGHPAQPRHQPAPRRRPREHRRRPPSLIRDETRPLTLLQT